MLTLHLTDNTILDLDPDTAVNITARNPIFDEEGSKRTFSFSFTLPATPRNLEALGYANRLDVPAARKYLLAI